MKRVLGRWLALAATLGLFNGCPRECEQPDGEVDLVSAEQDPSLGTFEGKLDWLQSADQSTLRVTISRPDEIAIRSCDHTRAGLTYEIATTDLVISTTRMASVSVTSDGMTIPQTEYVTIDPITLVDNGKLPDAPGIADRKPIGTLILEPTSNDELSATVQVRSSTDQLTAALGTLVRVP